MLNDKIKRLRINEITEKEKEKHLIALYGEESKTDDYKYFLLNKKIIEKLKANNVTDSIITKWEVLTKSDTIEKLKDNGQNVDFKKAIEYLEAIYTYLSKKSNELKDIVRNFEIADLNFADCAPGTLNRLCKLLEELSAAGSLKKHLVVAKRKCMQDLTHAFIESRNIELEMSNEIHAVTELMNYICENY